LDAALPGVVRGKSHGRLGRTTSISFAKLFEVPAADLNVAFRVAEQFRYILGRLALKFTEARFPSPFPGDQRGHLHQAYLARIADRCRTKIGLFVDQAPDKLFVDAIDPRLLRDQLVKAVLPIITKEKCARSEDQHQ